jgi:hypothetical protein
VIEPIGLQLTGSSITIKGASTTTEVDYLKLVAGKQTNVNFENVNIGRTLAIEGGVSAENVDLSQGSKVFLTGDLTDQTLVPKISLADAYASSVGLQVTIKYSGSKAASLDGDKEVVSNLAALGACQNWLKTATIDPAPSNEGPGYILSCGEMDSSPQLAEATKFALFVKWQEQMSSTKGFPDNFPGGVGGLVGVIAAVVVVNIIVFVVIFLVTRKPSTVGGKAGPPARTAQSRPPIRATGKPQATRKAPGPQKKEFELDELDEEADQPMSKPIITKKKRVIPTPEPEPEPVMVKKKKRVIPAPAPAPEPEPIVTKKKKKKVITTPVPEGSQSQRVNLLHQSLL